MRTWTFCGGLVASAVLIYAIASAQTLRVAPAPKNAAPAIEKAIDAYVTAFNKGDLDGVLAAWGLNAEYVDENGKSVKGRDALAGMFKTLMQEAKGGKLQIKTSALRFLKDDVAMQDGSAVMTDANGDVETAPFTAAWLKTDGNWQLQLVRDLPGPGAENDVSRDTPQNALKGLAWLVGSWSLEDKDVKTTLSAHWMTGEKFLVIEYEIRRKEASVMSVTQIVGWNPIEQQLHSWVFDSRGGSGEGEWSKQNNVWTVEATGVTLDGRHGSGIHRFKRVDANTFTFEALDRNLDGQPLPDVNVTYHRNKESK